MNWIKIFRKIDAEMWETNVNLRPDLIEEKVIRKFVKAVLTWEREQGQLKQLQGEIQNLRDINYELQFAINLRDQETKRLEARLKAMEKIVDEARKVRRHFHPIPPDEKFHCDLCRTLDAFDGLNP